MGPKKTDTKKKKEIPEIVNKLHEKHLEKIREENTKARKKRKRKLSESSLDELIKKLADEVVCENISKIKKVADEAVCENSSVIIKVDDEEICKNTSIIRNTTDDPVCENISIIKNVADAEESVCENVSKTKNIGNEEKAVSENISVIKNASEEEEVCENISIIKNVEGEVVCESITETQNAIDERREKDYLEWKEKHYDTYNSVSIENVIHGINILEKAINKKKGNPQQKRYCTSSNSVKSTEVVWVTSSYFIRYIKSCVLRHDWKPIACLLQYMLSHKRLYYGYIKEVTFLTSLMLSKENPNVMDSLKQCFRRRDMSYTNKYDIWYVNDD